MDALVLDGAPAANNLEDQRNYGQHQQDVDEPSQRETGQHSKQPENEQNCEDCPKHVSWPMLKLRPL
jgi:hypothetical protein